MIGALMEGTAVISMFLGPCFLAGYIEHKKAIKEQRRRELKLIHEMELVYAREEAERQAQADFVAQLKRNVATSSMAVDGELARFERSHSSKQEVVEARKPRKWGRHAG